MYEHKELRPMLIGKEQAAFDDENYIYELKLDGVRCLAYIDKDGVELRNKRNQKLNDKFPELMSIHHQVHKKCILDGEVYVYKAGDIDFFEVQKRTLMSDKFKIRLASHRYPATFTAFDCLYLEDTSLMEKPLMKRKKILAKLMKENMRINISRYIEAQGCKLFTLTQQQHLEGIVAKQKDSRYYPDKRSKEWIKCKNQLEDDFAICGYLRKEKNIVSFVLGQYRHGCLVYKGHVTMGTALDYLIAHTNRAQHCPFETDIAKHEEAVWIQPMLCGVVKFMEYTSQGGLRQPVFKGFRDDKRPQDCMDTWFDEKETIL